MSFDVAAEAYWRFMGRFSEPLSVKFATWLPLAPGQRILDVGCGPGALTAELVSRLGAGQVSAIDPSPSFVQAVREQLPGVDVRSGAAEALPWPDESFDATVAQLVVHLMADAPAGIAEMARVTRPGGTVAATVWDFAGGKAPLSVFWDAAKEIDPAAPGEAELTGARDGHLAALLAGAGLHRIESTALTVSAGFSSFEDWWEPFTLGIGLAGPYLARLDDESRASLRDACARRLPAGPFTLTARSWTARGRA